MAGFLRRAVAGAGGAKRRARSAAIAVLLAVCAGSAAAQEIVACPSDANVPEAVAGGLDTVLKAMSDPDAPLASRFGYAPGGVLSVQSPDWRYARAIGVADPETGRPITCDMPFQIGSNTKMMTAAAVLQLHERGALSIDDLLSAHLPELAAALPHGEEITLRQLATHTSGVFSYTDDTPDGTPGIMESGMSDGDARRKGYAPRELVDFAIKHGAPSFAPGEGWAYSNTGYILLGMVIEKIDGRPIADVFAERFFRPLGMAGTVYENDVPDPKLGLPRAYLAAPFDLETSDWNMSQGGAAGAVISTADDMHVFIEALLTGDVFASADTLALMKQTVPTKHPVLPGYGVGLASKGPNVWGHGGETLGYESDVAFFADRNVSMVGWATSSQNVMAVGANAVTGALIGAGVLPDPAIAMTAKLRGEMTGAEWRLTSIDAGNAGVSDVGESERYSITFDEGGGFSAVADCNRVHGNWALDRLKLSITPGPATLAACSPNSLADAYIHWLAGAQSAFVAEGSLTIVSDRGDGGAFLKFRSNE